MIYFDTSVVLAALLNETKRPSPSFWVTDTGSSTKTSSRLLEYEVVVRLNALKKSPKAIQSALDFLDGVDLIDMEPAALESALKPFPVSVRTLDAIHLSTMMFLRARGVTVSLATYDGRMERAAKAIGFQIAKL